MHRHGLQMCGVMTIACSPVGSHPQGVQFRVLCLFRESTHSRYHATMIWSHASAPTSYVHDIDICSVMTIACSPVGSHPRAVHFSELYRKCVNLRIRDTSRDLVEARGSRKYTPEMCSVMTIACSPVGSHP